MKNIVFLLICTSILASCATSKVEESAKKESARKETAKNESAKEQKIVRQEEIKQAVEMRRFLIKFDRLYSSTGGRIDLIPKSNYILLDGERVVISAAYFGRQYSTRSIKGIDVVGKAVSYELKNNSSKGTYDIRMKVKNDMNTFEVSVNINNKGVCNASVSNNKIDQVRYTGNFIPLKPKIENPKPESDPETVTSLY